ncbi:MAG: ComEC/Rec2 family competence protein [Verrucomicrobia bacterium]|nr:ComEC/Rec2 family competence protein [Cytophagales bacterium]
MTRYAFVRLVIFLIGGIILCEYTDVYYDVFLMLFGSFIGVYFLVFVLSKVIFRAFQLNIIFAGLAFGAIFCLGYVMAFRQNSLHQPRQLANDTSQYAYYQGIIVAEVQEKTKFYQTQVQINAIKTKIGWKATSGKIMLNIRLDSNYTYRYGDQIIVKGQAQLLANPANPNQFNYKRYLNRQQIFHQHFISPQQILVMGNHQPNVIIGFAINIRQYFDAKLRELIPSEDEYAIATGIILGVRSQLDNEIKQAYSAAGAMHVLAVSGMHVALLFVVLQFLLGKVQEVKYGKVIFAVLVLSILWLYCLATGLSASVLRSIVMFSCIVLAGVIKRNTNIYNTLAFSAFVLLCINPFLIFDTGFQLSYLAVLGIVAFYNPIYNLFTSKYHFLNMVWSITCVSLAAQLATFPLSFYHFHQFPTYFWLANLVIIPISTLVLYAGLLTLAVSWIPWVSLGAAFILRWLIWALNQSVFLTEKIPGSVISGIDIDTLEVVLLYLCILGIVLLFLKRKLYWLVLSVICLVGVASVSLYESFTQKSQQQLAIFSINKHAVLDLVIGQKHIFVSDSALLANEASWGFNLKNHWWYKGVAVKKATFTTFDNLEKYYPVYYSKEGFSVLVWEGKKYLFLRQKLSYLENLIEKITPDYLIVQNNSLQKLPKNITKKINIILDSSNSIYTSAKIKKTSAAIGVNCFAVLLEGAFIKATY